ncbi:hypothetical protein [Chryseobacterium culicis]|uniref:hypothetical protein n=1 Tax=Chryseobacterium culicis TaxID=680127 RepID=UPI000B7F1313|nr:hypothetical protein [Chryseobacterium culicis]
MMKAVTLILSIILIFISCNKHKIEKYEHTRVLKLYPNERFLNITWKQNNLWVIVEDTVKNEIYAREKSVGLIQRKIIIKR